MKLLDALRKPVEGATVTLTAGSSPRSDVSTADGVATFDGVPIGPDTLAAEALVLNSDPSRALGCGTFPQSGWPNRRRRA